MFSDCSSSVTHAFHFILILPSPHFIPLDWLSDSRTWLTTLMCLWPGVVLCPGTRSHDCRHAKQQQILSSYRFFSLSQSCHTKAETLCCLNRMSACLIANDPTATTITNVSLKSLSSLTLFLSPNIWYHWFQLSSCASLNFHCRSVCTTTNVM